jgi:hypothetical protein
MKFLEGKISGRNQQRPATLLLEGKISDRIQLRPLAKIRENFEELGI